MEHYLGRGGRKLFEKLKINAKSFTESELAGMDDAFSRLLWVMYVTEKLRGTQLTRTLRLRTFLHHEA